MDNLVSVIVPVYNMELYLDRSIQSVLNQSYGHFELLLIDDGSTDRSGGICDDYAAKDCRIRVFHQTNHGVSSARNVGIREMRGEYFLFLDADDALGPETIITCVNALKNSIADVVVFGRREFQNNETIRVEQYAEQTITDINGMIRQILEDRHIFGGGYPNKMWRTETFIAQNGVPLFSEKLFYVEDMEWVIRMLLKVKCVQVIDPVLYLYDLREDSVSHSSAASEKRLIGYHDSMARIVDALAAEPDLQTWFTEKRYSELINSILDAKLKKQKEVYQSLYLQLKGNKVKLLSSDLLSAKMKMRLILVLVMHSIGIL